MGDRTHKLRLIYIVWVNVKIRQRILETSAFLIRGRTFAHLLDIYTLKSKF